MEVKDNWVGLHFIPLYFTQTCVEEVVESLKRKALLVHVGLDEFTPAEKLAYHILKDNKWVD